MKRTIAFLFCCLFSFAFAQEPELEELLPSIPDQIATLNSEPSYLIGGLINPLSGQLSLRQTDLIVKGAQDLSLTRIYIPPYMPCHFPEHKKGQVEWDKIHLHEHLAKHYKGWQFLPHLKLQFNPRLMEVRLTDPNGTTLDFHLSKESTTLISPPYAISNTAGDIPSGKYDPRNTNISHLGDLIIVYAPDGITRYYVKKGPATPSVQFFFLQKEVLTNGKVIKYHLNDELQPIYVESLDPGERFVYASIRINGSPREGHCHFLSSSNVTTDYSYQKKSVLAKIKEKHYKATHSLTYPPILISVSSPFYRQETLSYCDRFLLVNFFGKDDLFTCCHIRVDQNDPHYRVYQLSRPVGQNDTFYPLYELGYQPPIPGRRSGSTTIKNSDGTKTIYHFSKKFLIKSIQYFGQDGNLKKEKKYSWNKQNWLKNIEIRDGQNHPFYTKIFEYDSFGNPILETLIGNLDRSGLFDSFTIKRTFSQDGKNLLLKEESEDGKVLIFSYLPNTDLITSKLIQDCDKILLREFFTYDDCHNLIQHIIDDGSSEDKNNLTAVSQRTITNYRLRQQAPFLHMPEWIEEKYWEDGIEKPLTTKHLLYDQYGNIKEEQVFDATGILAYTLYKEYNERGDLLSETNPLGQKALYTYNAKGQLETSLNFSQRLHKTFHRDTKGRLKQLTEKGHEGITHVSSFEYDIYDHLIQQTIPFHHTSHYTYDPLVNQIIKSDYPRIASIDGHPVSVTTHSTYDSLGREASKTDANDNITFYR